MPPEQSRETILNEGEESFDINPEDEGNEFAGWEDEDEDREDPRSLQETDEVEGEEEVEAKGEAEEPAEEEPPAEDTAVPEAEAGAKTEPEPEPIAPTSKAAELETKDQVDPKALRDQAVESIAARYQKSQEEWDEVWSKADEHLPKMLAEVQVAAYEAAVQTITSQLPGMLQSLNQQRDADKALEDEFFAAWPGLKGQDRGSIRDLAVRYRQINPNVEVGQAIEEVGMITASRLGIPLDKAKGRVEPPPADPPPRPVSLSRSAPSAKERPLTEWEELGEAVKFERGI